MAKVELVVDDGIWPPDIELGQPIDKFPKWFNKETEDAYDEYADKVWQEFQLFTLVDELLGKRKVVQRKIDAARKRLKRLTDKLNVIEGSWNPA